MKRFLSPLLPIWLVLGVCYGLLVWNYQSSQNTKSADYNTPVAQSIIPQIHDSIDRPPTENDKRKQQDQEKHDLEIADHKAQIWMARYAFFGVLLGVFGSFLLYKTLLYTRKAAEAAGNTLTEAREATRAAWASVESTREIGKAQVRAYLAAVSGKIEINFSRVRPNDEILRMMHCEAVIKFVNSGQSPAKEVMMASAFIVTHQGIKFDLNGGRISMDTVPIGERNVRISTGGSGFKTDIADPRRVYIKIYILLFCEDVFGDSIKTPVTISKIIDNIGTNRYEFELTADDITHSPFSPELESSFNMAIDSFRDMGSKAQNGGNEK